MAGATPRWKDILAFARMAEDLGFDSLWVWDHFVLPWGDGSARTAGCWECLSLVSALAAVTSRVSLGTWVNCTIFRNPALLAKIADTADEISGGRLILGLGAGWDELEFRAFGYPFDHRTSRFEEALAIIYPLLREGRVDYVGTYFQARECELRPRGPRPAGPELLLGGHGPRGLRLAARYADVWDAAYLDHADAPRLRAAVDAACVEIGRNPATLSRSGALRVQIPGSAPYPPGYPAWTASPLTGSAAELAEHIRGYAREGYTNLILRVNPPTVAGIERLADVLALLD
jgi:alkanesulfonate monooxygenase SsuD/methylene tetrahydromethanopterin reductase-like flavin-dependent oxidoreductase (luciferase family)